MKTILNLIFNGLIFLSCLLSYWRFRFGFRYYKHIQNQIFNKIFRKNKQVAFIKENTIKHKNSQNLLPLTNWTDYAPYIDKLMAGEGNGLTKERVLLLEPTSGTTAPTKYIPYTAGLQKEFNKAIQPWLAGLYLAFPRLLSCTQYWSISPDLQTISPEEPTHIQIGFENDTQYLGDERSNFFNRIMAAPKLVKTCQTREAWVFLTAYFLLRDRRLGLISVWHPSFLTILLKEIKSNINILNQAIETGEMPSIQGMPEMVKTRIFKPMPKRAQEISKLDFSAVEVFEKIWPQLQVISCWADDPGEPCLKEIQEMFPTTFIQPKGIIATEGIISIPLGRHVGIPAFRSHYMEFIDIKNEQCKPLHTLETNQTYEVVITTSGGLYRYRLYDLVKVTGRHRNLPQLKFLGKRNYVSDIRGEKLNVIHIDDIHKDINKKFPGIVYFMISPYIEDTTAHYICFLLVKDAGGFPYKSLLQHIEKRLDENYHYQYARQINQLAALQLFLLSEDPTEAIVKYVESTGVSRGNIKLYTLNSYPDWPSKLKGRWIEKP